MYPVSMLAGKTVTINADHFVALIWLYLSCLGFSIIIAAFFATASQKVTRPDVVWQQRRS
jgi:hypothetical protein